jgi:hypothetical protein
MIGGPTPTNNNRNQPSILGYATFEDEEGDGESQHVVHQLPVN